MVIRSEMTRMGVRTKDIDLPTTKFDLESSKLFRMQCAQRFPNRISDPSQTPSKNSSNQRLSSSCYLTGSTEQLRQAIYEPNSIIYPDFQLNTYFTTKSLQSQWKYLAESTLVRLKPRATLRVMQRYALLAKQN